MSHYDEKGVRKCEKEYILLYLKMILRVNVGILNILWPCTVHCKGSTFERREKKKLWEGGEEDVAVKMIWKERR